MIITVLGILDVSCTGTYSLHRFVGPAFAGKGDEYGPASLHALSVSFSSTESDHYWQTVRKPTSCGLAIAGTMTTPATIHGISDLNDFEGHPLGSEQRAGNFALLRHRSRQISPCLQRPRPVGGWPSRVEGQGKVAHKPGGDGPTRRTSKLAWRCR